MIMFVGCNTCTGGWEDWRWKQKAIRSVVALGMLLPTFVTHGLWLSHLWHLCFALCACPHSLLASHRPVLAVLYNPDSEKSQCDHLPSQRWPKTFVHASSWVISWPQHKPFFGQLSNLSYSVATLSPRGMGRKNLELLPWTSARRRCRDIGCRKHSHW